ncbi:hypothetical protein IAR55_004975 [Kwoniella newhampshirensis]|uniref:VWFA domain-containing protein n=1 Tax=Kwoniella newhampshirensis TaxID=1651941 RepID=A0AAW0YIM1_9TREE
MAQRAPIERGSRFSGNIVRREDRKYQVDPMETSNHVVWAFNNRLLTQDPEYIKCVLRSYVEYKSYKGRGRSEIGYKLQPLEEEFPRFAKQFVEIRIEYGLPPSPLIRVTRRTSEAGVPPPNANTLRRTQTAAASSLRPANASISRTRTSTGATTNRPAQQDGDEPPPPPYASQDPEPEATRMLQEQLAAAAGPSGLATSATTTGPSVSSPPATPARPFSVSTPSSTRPPPQPRTPTRAAEVEPPASPPPSDPEMARVWEESQLAEAKRASLAAQREQEELDEVMRLSLAEAESIYQGSSSRPQEAGSSRQPVTINPDIQALASGVDSLTMPGDWQGPPSRNRPTDSSLDLQDNSSHSHPPLSPSRTGAHLKSKNPFLSSAEREHLQADEASGESSEDLYRPRSSYTQYEAPSQATYAPPPGPPPPHLRVATPPHTSVPSSLPARSTDRQSFGWDDDTQASLQSPANLQPPLQPQPTASHSFAPPLGQPPTLPPRRTSYLPPHDEDPLETLKDFDTVFLVDDSTSMAGERWEQARQALMEVADIASRYDENGVDVFFLNSKRVGKELKGAHEMEELFAGLVPKGATPTGIRLEAILREYMSKLERSQVVSPGSGVPGEKVKPMNLIVVTDGVFSRPISARMRALASHSSLNRAELLAKPPTDDPESVLIACAKRLDRGDFPLSQIGVQFLQIGDDSEAREALQELDDGISAAHGVRDMVDSVPFTGEEMSAGLIIKTLLGGINRRLDRRSTAKIGV